VSSVSITNWERVEAIQNIALRKIFHLPFDCSAEIIREKTGIKSLKERMLDLGSKYLEKSWVSNNPLTLDMINSFLQFSCGGRSIKRPTFLCLFKEKLKALSNPTVN
jgi:hypothetical protein